MRKKTDMRARMAVLASQALQQREEAERERDMLRTQLLLLIGFGRGLIATSKDDTVRSGGIAELSIRIENAWQILTEEKDHEQQ